MTGRAGENEEDRCCSYNLQIGEEREIALDPPVWSNRKRPIMVDACIAKAVQHLWDNGHITLGSCCGHGGRVNPRPSLVLGEYETDYADIRRVLAEVDDREWELMQWRIGEVGVDG